MRAFIIIVFMLSLAVMPALSIASATAPETVLKSAVQVDKTFMDAPAQRLAEIYKDFHDWHVDKGIDDALAALKEVDAMYAKDPAAVIADKSLKINKTYQIKSTLHTMLGMLYYRKSMLVLREGTPDARQAVMDKLKAGQEITEEDLARVADEADSADSGAGTRDSMIAKAVSEFKTASETDPTNPSPHYQAAAIYSAMPPVDSANLAEVEYLKGAELSIKEGQKDVARGALRAIKDMNPESVYIARIEKMLAQ